MRSGVVYTTNFVTPADLSYSGIDIREPVRGERIRHITMPSGQSGFIAAGGDRQVLSIPERTELRCPSGHLCFRAHGSVPTVVEADFASLRYVKPLFRRGRFYLNWFDRHDWVRSEVRLEWIKSGHVFFAEP